MVAIYRLTKCHTNNKTLDLSFTCAPDGHLSMYRPLV